MYKMGELFGRYKHILEFKTVQVFPVGAKFCFWKIKVREFLAVELSENVAADIFGETCLNTDRAVLHFVIAHFYANLFNAWQLYSKRGKAFKNNAFHDQQPPENL